MGTLIFVTVSILIASSTFLIAPAWPLPLSLVVVARSVLLTDVLSTGIAALPRRYPVARVAAVSV